MGRSMTSSAGSVLAFVAAIMAAGWMIFGPNDARSQSGAVDAGSAPARSARLDAGFHSPQGGFVRSDFLHGPDEWLAECRDVETDSRLSDYAFNVPGKGEVLHEWDGSTVTCYLADDRVIGVKLPDGAVLKSDKVGWRGAVARWLAGSFALAVALLIGATRLRMGFWTGLAGGLLMALTVAVALHLSWLPIALAIDGAVLVGLALFVVLRVRGHKSARSGEASEPSGT